jgi:hypothetical protein
MFRQCAVATKLFKNGIASSQYQNRGKCKYERIEIRLCYVTAQECFCRGDKGDSVTKLHRTCETHCSPIRIFEHLILL